MKKNIFTLVALFLIGATLQAQTNTTNASGSFQATIATSDSAIRLQPTATGITSKYVIVQALPTNTGYIAVGVTKGRITAASLDTPIVIVSASHGLATGQRISIVGVQGNTAANGSWPVTVISADTLTIDSAAANAAYYRNGIWTDVSTTAGYERGDQLRAGGSTVIVVDDVSQVWINGTAGDGVIWRYGRGDAPTPVIEGGTKQADSSLVLLNEVIDTLNIRLPSPYGIVSDSVGTAQDSWWNTVDLFNTNPKHIEVLNKSSVAILATISAADTAANRTRYQKRIDASTGWGAFKTARYVYIKSTSGAAAYRVGGQ